VEILSPALLQNIIGARSENTFDLVLGVRRSNIRGDFSLRDSLKKWRKTIFYRG